MARLAALAMAGFITILTEVLPAGLLPQIALSLNGTVSAMGQLITVYALGSLLAAIPLMAATQTIRRRPLFLSAIIGFGIVNTVTALSDNFVLTLIARFFAGVSAGLVWAMLAGYAVRMVRSELAGRAIAVAMAGTPIALSIGIPAATFMGNEFGWRSAFGALTGLTVVLIVWILVSVPDFAGVRAEKSRSLAQVWVLPGIRSILFLTLLYVLSHNILYTYISPQLALAGLSEETDRVLLVFGVAALIGLWAVGTMITQWLWQLTLLSILLFAITSLVFILLPTSPVAVYVAVAVWGLAFGGAATLFLTGISNAAGPSQDIAQSMMVTFWNCAIAGGGLVGGLLLGSFGAPSFSVVTLVLLAIAALILWLSRSQSCWRGARDN